jgi:type IV fimbrial biogenesis protein FimT
MIELMIGLVIVGLLLVFAVPSYTAWLNNSQIRTAAESILNGMQLARAEAVRQNTTVQFALTNLPMSDWAVSVVANSAVVQTRSSAEGSATARINTTLPTGATVVTFNGLGRVTANVPASTSLTEADVTSTATSATRSLNVRVGGVSGGGMVRMCDPALPATNPQSCSS